MIWKFGPLVEFDEDGTAEPQPVAMPHGAMVLHVGRQGGAIYLWAFVNPTAPKVTRGFLVYGTGWTIRAGAQYRGTLAADPFVWHVYEVGS